MALNALKKFWNIRLNAKGEPIPLSGDISSITPDGAVDVQASAADITLADGKVLIGNVSGVAAAQNMSGDVTMTNAGVVTIGSAQVTYAKMQNVSATDKVLGRKTAGAGVVEEIDCTSAGRALLDDVSAAAQRTTLGLGDLAVLSNVKKGQLSYKSVAVTVSTGNSSGSSSNDADLVGGEILGIYPTSNQDQFVDSVALDVNGAVTVTLAANATADNVFKVVVLRNV